MMMMTKNYKSRMTTTVWLQRNTKMKIMTKEKDFQRITKEDDDSTELGKGG